MRTTKLTKSFIAICLMLCTATTADAQFSGILNKVKKAAKETVSKKTNNAAQSSQEEALSTIPQAVGMSYNPFKTYSPSKNAKAADPEASNTEVKKNYTKSPAAIRGAYEHLDKSLFPYQPYYNYNGTGLYLDGTQKTEDFVYYMSSEVRRMIDESDDMIHGFSCTHSGTVPLGNSGKCVPWQEVPVNAFFAEYLADPNSYLAYRQMIKAYIITEREFLGNLKITLDAGSDQTVTNKDGKNTLFEPETQRLKRNHELQGVVFDVAMQSKYDNVFNATYSMLTQANKAYDSGKMAAALTNLREFVTSYDFFLTKHEGWAKDSRANEFAAMYKEARTKLTKAKTAVIEESVPPIAMPKTYTASADIKKMAQAALAKEDPEHKNAPIVFLSNGWRTLKNSGRITHRAIDVGWTYTDDNGQRWLAKGVMMQQAEYRGLTVVYLEGRYAFSGGHTRCKIK